MFERSRRRFPIHALFVAGSFAGATVIHEAAVHAQASATNGSLRGVLKDKASNDVPFGATVVATSPALQGEQVVIVDENGQYFLTSLPPGTYLLTVYYNNTTYTRPNVLVQVGKEAVVNITLDTSAAGEIIVIKGSPPIIDQGSTKTGVTITPDYTNNIPGGRTFGALLGAAASAQGDFYGTSIGGATSVENTYIVEGINTTDTAFGQLSSNLPNEFVQETEVITGGYNAEFGRATGGIVNVVTKQGGNEFHGTVFAHYTPGQLSATAKTIQREGGSIDSHTDLSYAYDVGGEIGGPIIKDKLWFHVGFNPSSNHAVTTRLVRSQVDKNQDGIADVDPNTGITLHDDVASSAVPQYRNTYFFTAKINGAIDQNNQFQLSAFGNPSRGEANNFASPLTFAPGDNLLTQNNGAYDIAAKYTSKLNEGKTQIDAVVGFHRAYSNQTPLNALGNRSLVFYNYERSLNDFGDLEGSGIAPTVNAANPNTCNDHDPNDPYPMIRNCPVSQYADQGLGNLEHRTNDRTSAIVSATQRVKALGYHTFKAGLDLELSTYDSNQGFTGGAFYKRACNIDPATHLPAADCDDPNALPGRWQVNRFDNIVRNLTPQELMDPGSVSLQPGQVISPDCAGGLAICGQLDRRVVNTSDRSLGAYLQDSWQILPNFTLNGGLRFEQQALENAAQLVGTPLPTGEIVPSKAFTLNNWAPRLGAIYDPTKDGKSKMFVHWGRFFENIPMDINVRSFGGEIDNIGNLNQHRLRPGQAGYNPACNVDHTPGIDPAAVLAGCTDFQQSGFFGGGTEFVAPDLRGQHVDELVLGAEYEPINDIKVGVTYTHRTIGDVIEDMSTDGANNYLIANPGRNYDAEASSLHAQSMAMMDSNPTLAGALQQRADQLSQLKHFDPPSRNYDALTLRAEQRPTKKSLLIASYTYSVEKGNYPGLFSTETNQLDPNITAQYDLPDLMANRYGSLGLDRPHNLKIDGFYQFDLDKAGVVVLGASFRAQSGIAHNALGTHPTYGIGEAYLLPRGSIARSPLTSNTDLHVSYGRRLNKTTLLEAFVRVFNLFDQQDELNVDENYTLDNAQPVVGGDMTDLQHAKSLPDGVSTANQTLRPNKNFDHSNLLTPPRSFEFGLRLSF